MFNSPNPFNPLTWIRAGNSWLGPVVPTLSAAVAEHLFTTPRRHAPPARERAAELEGRRVELGAGRSALLFRPWNHQWRPRGRILAIHGWEGRASQWGPFAEAATQAGFEVLAVDAPAHGRSLGKTANPAIFAEALLEADRRYGPFTAIVGHSMGGAAATLAVHRGLRVGRIVMIASPSAIVEVLRRFSSYIQLPPAAERRFFDRVEAAVGLGPDEFDLATLVLRQPTLVIHSRDDREIPFTEAEAIAETWPHAKLLEVAGLGHRRILRDPAVVTAALGFVELELETEAEAEAEPAPHH